MAYYSGAFDRLVADLAALDEHRERAQHRAEPARLAKSLHSAQPVDFSAIRAQQQRLQRQIERDHERHTRQQCAANITRLSEAAKAGRLTGVQGAKLDQLRARFGAMTATPFTPPIRPSTPPRAA